MNLSLLKEILRLCVKGRKKPASDALAYLNEGMLVFDIGANMGDYASLFLEKGARVVALEPQNYCYRFLKFRYLLGRKITILRKGAGASNEKMTLLVSSSHTLSSFNTQWIDKVTQTERFSASQPTWKKSDEIEMVTLDQLIGKYGEPDYIKIDVEGFEKEVLKGLHHPAGLISFEFTVPELTEDVIFCIEHLCTLGNYQFLSFRSSSALPVWVNREEILKQIHQMHADQILHNGDMFAKLVKE